MPILEIVAWVVPGFILGVLVEKFLHKRKIRKSEFLDTMDFEKKAKLRETIKGASK